MFQRGTLRALRLVLQDLDERIQLVEHLLDRFSEQLHDEAKRCPHYPDHEADRASGTPRGPVSGPPRDR
jgi:hypothetical protein